MAISQPGNNSPLSLEDAKENLSGFERASQEIEKASQKQSPEHKGLERVALTELQSDARPMPGMNYAGENTEGFLNDIPALLDSMMRCHFTGLRAQQDCFSLFVA